MEAVFTNALQKRLQALQELCQNWDAEEHSQRRWKVSIRRRPQGQTFFRDRHFHFAARASTFLRRLAVSSSLGS